ncbi:MAG: hypothetical protein KJ930_17890 [Gammaproteobacteria bacterium]|nr:hypothetical protein [Gammaproteobacteria bacterium]MBU2181296.1 hypothetical protein [Gammaproteobacteria bacterium]
MQTLIPVPAFLGKSNNEIVLLDPARLKDWQGVDRTLPKILCKTAIYGNHSAGWSLYLQENGCYEWLIGSDVVGSSSGALDMIALLGHNLCLMPWQKLVFCSEGLACTAISYIWLPGLVELD